MKNKGYTRKNKINKKKTHKKYNIKNKNKFRKHSKRNNRGGSVKRQYDEINLYPNKKQEFDNNLVDINDVLQQNQQQNQSLNELYSLGFNEESLEMYFEEQNNDVTPQQLIDRFSQKLRDHNIDISLDEIKIMGQEDEIGNSGLSKYDIANEVLYE